MKFFKANTKKIKNNKLTAINFDAISCDFFKNGIYHNSKNAAYIDNSYKEFCLNGEFYGDESKFTKSSWRKFTKLQAFL